VAEKLADLSKVEKQQTGTNERLSDREFQFYTDCFSQSVRDIADQLSLSPATIATYRAAS